MPFCRAEGSDVLENPTAKPPGETSAAPSPWLQALLNEGLWGRFPEAPRRRKSVRSRGSGLRSVKFLLTL